MCSCLRVSMVHWYQLASTCRNVSWIVWVGRTDSEAGGRKVLKAKKNKLLVFSSVIGSLSLAQVAVTL